MITIYAFKSVPEFAKGVVRDLRARWALEEAGLPYRARLLGQGDQDKPDDRALQPFGQVPVLEEDGLVLFESGAIVLHIGERFTAGDLMMTTVLRILRHTDIVSSDPCLAAYVERCTARPAFKRALDAQLGDYQAAA